MIQEIKFNLELLTSIKTLIEYRNGYRPKKVYISAARHTQGHPFFVISVTIKNEHISHNENGEIEEGKENDYDLLMFRHEKYEDI